MTEAVLGDIPGAAFFVVARCGLRSACLPHIFFEGFIGCQVATVI